MSCRRRRIRQISPDLPGGSYTTSVQQDHTSRVHVISLLFVNATDGSKAHDTYSGSSQGLRFIVTILSVLCLPTCMRLMRFVRQLSPFFVYTNPPSCTSPPIASHRTSSDQNLELNEGCLVRSRDTEIFNGNNEHVPIYFQRVRDGAAEARAA